MKAEKTLWMAVVWGMFGLLLWQVQPAQSADATATGEEEATPVAGEITTSADEQLDTETGDSGGVEAQREWLRDQLRAKLTSERLLKAMHARVDEMSPKQITRAIAVQKRNAAREKKELQQAQRRLQRAQAVRGELRLRVARQLAFGNQFGPVGFAPVVTWFPSGTHFHTHGIVSHGRRHVRLYAKPVPFGARPSQHV